MTLASDELQRGFELGPWQVQPSRGQINRDKTEEHLEPMVMDVLLVLAAHQGEVVTKDQLVDAVWKGRATTDDTIAAKIRILRKKLGDDSRNPTYIETVQKRGYRLRASVPVRSLARTEAPAPRLRNIAMLIGILVVAAVTYAFLEWPQPVEPVDAIAVIPFRNLSDDPARYQYIVDGFGEELVVALDRIPDLQLTRGNPVLDGASAQRIANDLDVGAIIAGSLRTDGETIRITIEMTSKDGFLIWSDRIDGEAGRIFEFQEFVARQVHDRVTESDDKVFDAVTRPASAAAIDTYMRGLFFLARRDYESLLRADELFAETTREDPGYGPAYLRRAITLLLLADYSPAERQEIYNQALAIAQRGADNHADISEAMQLVHAFVHHQRGNLAEASRSYDVALRSPTRYPTVFHWYSRLLGDLGLLEGSLEQATIARNMEPASQVLNSRLAIAYLWVNDMESAGRYFEIANEIGVGVPDHYLGMAMYFLRRGQHDEARDAVHRAFRMAQRPSDWVDDVFASLADPADEASRLEAEKELEQAVAAGQVPAYVSLAVWVLFGNVDRAMDIALEEAAEQGAIYELEIVFIDEFAEFRRHPDFPRLMDELGVTPHWQSAGCTLEAGELQCASQ